MTNPQLATPDWSQFPTSDEIYGLSLALGIGLLIGVERGWRMRDEDAGSRVAGVRTFTLLGLIGGLAGLPQPGQLQIVTLILAGASAIALLVGYRSDIKQDGNVSATSAIAGLLTLALGAVAASGELALASVAAGVTVILLSSRERLHKALIETSSDDIKALVRLVLVVLVILPLLPDTDIGPYGLNPRRLWNVVVVTGAVSFVGYALVRIVGGSKGALLTAVVGALVSSTAVTLECARQIRGDQSVHANQAAIVVASFVMMARALLLVSVLTPTNLSGFAALVTPGLALTGLVAAALVFRARRDPGSLDSTGIRPPDLKLALLFGGLVLIMTLSAGWAEQRLQGSGAAVVAVGGLFDVDSAIAALGAIPAGTFPLRLAALAIAAPVVFNSLLKAGLALAIAGTGKGAVPALGLAGPAIVIAGAMMIAAITGS